VLVLLARYEKTKVQNRAAAATYAVVHGLCG